MYYIGNVICDPNYLEHHGVLGMKWGVRRFQNHDGSLTVAGKARYAVGSVREKAKSAIDTRKAKQRAQTKKALDFWGHGSTGRTLSAGVSLAHGVLQHHGLMIASNIVNDLATKYAANTGRLWVIKTTNMLTKAVLVGNAANVAVGVASNFTYKDEPKDKARKKTR